MIHRQIAHFLIIFGFCLPEFFAENLGDFFIFLRRFADDILETSAECLENILNFITIFMGNQERSKSPHDQ